jgi:hypothetical protein
MSYDEVKRYATLYAIQSFNSTILERNLAERHEMNVFLGRMEARGKLSDADFESGKRIILSAKIRGMEMREIENALNTSYTKLLSQEH